MPTEPVKQGVVKLPFVDMIWRVRGEMSLDTPIAADEAFSRLDPLFQMPGTTYAVDEDILTYTKRNPAAQDKLATFTRGALQIEQRERETVLRYDLSSTALLLCFLAPLLFLGFAQLAVAANAWEKASVEASAKSEKEDEKLKALKKLNPIDRFLGAPAPDHPDKKKDTKKDDGRHSPTPGYVLAGLFFVIYLVGRVLEPWLIQRRFRNAIADQRRASSPAAPQDAAVEA